METVEQGCYAPEARSSLALQLLLLVLRGRVGAAHFGVRMVFRRRLEHHLLRLLDWQCCVLGTVAGEPAAAVFGGWVGGGVGGSRGVPSGLGPLRGQSARLFVFVLLLLLQGGARFLRGGTPRFVLSFVHKVGRRDDMT